MTPAPDDSAPDDLFYEFDIITYCPSDDIIAKLNIIILEHGLRYLVPSRNGLTEEDVIFYVNKRFDFVMLGIIINKLNNILNINIRYCRL